MVWAAVYGKDIPFWFYIKLEAKMNWVVKQKMFWDSVGALV